MGMQNKRNVLLCTKQLCITAVQRQYPTPDILKSINTLSLQLPYWGKGRALICDAIDL